MESLWFVAAAIYVIYTIVKAFQKKTTDTTLPQPQKWQSKAISTKEGVKSLEEILERARRKQQKKIEKEENYAIKKYEKNEVVSYEEKSKEIKNYEIKNYEISTTKKNKSKSKTKLKPEKYRKSVVETYSNNDNIDLKFDKDSVKKAFIISEILQKKY